MPQLFYFGAVLGIAALLSAPISAETPAPTNAPNASPNSKKIARIEHVVVRGSGETGAAIAVEIQTSGATVAPDTQAITGPDRIIVDFPGALPAAELRALQVNRGALKAVRAGLFFSNPPITRVVLDLREPQSYQISTTGNAIVVELNPSKLNPARLATMALTPVAAARTQTTESPSAPAARLKNAALASSAKVVTANISTTVPQMMAAPILAAASEDPAPPLKGIVSVTYAKGMLRIHADKATLAQILFEVQRETQADIAIPAGAELEKVVADLGPAPAGDVLASLLNGSRYNFIFVGNEERLESVILTRRDPNSP
jgi:hypothetical protein